METNILIAIIAVSGTLAGAIVSAIATYLIQSKAYEREREQGKEVEQRRIKRESLSKRLDVIEEVVNLMMYFISRTIGKELDMPIYDDDSLIKEKRKRLEDIRGQAWTTVLAINSEDLSNKYRAISSAYWDNEEYGTVGPEGWDKANKCFVEIIRIIDNMKATAH